MPTPPDDPPNLVPLAIPPVPAPGIPPVDPPVPAPGIPPEDPPVDPQDPGGPPFGFAAGHGYNGQVEGTSDGVVPPGSILTGFAFAVSTGGWMVRVTGNPCAGGFTAEENWPAPPSQWPAAFTITKVLYSHGSGAAAAWHDKPGNLRNDGPGKLLGDAPSPTGFVGIIKGPTPAVPYFEVRKDGVFVANVKVDAAGVHWTNPNPTSDRVWLNFGELLSFTKKT